MHIFRAILLAALSVFALFAGVRHSGRASDLLTGNTAGVMHALAGLGFYVLCGVLVQSFYENYIAKCDCEECKR